MRSKLTASVLPRNISVIKDKDEGADKLRLPELEQKLRDGMPSLL